MSILKCKVILQTKDVGGGHMNISTILMGSTMCTSSSSYIKYNATRYEKCCSSQFGGEGNQSYLYQKEKKHSLEE